MLAQRRGRGQPALAPGLDVGDSTLGAGFGHPPKTPLAVAMGGDPLSDAIGRVCLQVKEERKNLEPADCST